MTGDLLLENRDQIGGRAAILSIKPKYAALILKGTKKVELRRNWPTQKIGALVLYASAPIQKFVGLAYVEKVVESNFDDLWNIANNNGAGVTYEELKTYLSEKPMAFGVMINRVDVADVELDPKDIFKKFSPPQSLSLISPADFQKIFHDMFPTETTI